MQDTGAIYGAERATLDLAAALAATGAATPHVILIHETRLGDRPSALRAAWQAAGVPLAELPTDRPFSPALVQAIRRTLAAWSADVLHCVGYKADLHGGWASGWGRRTPAVATVHGWLFRRDLKERAYGLLDLLALRRFSRVIALSRHYENWLQQRLPPGRVVRIPSGLPATAIPDAAIAAAIWDRPAPFTWGILGRLSDEKNHGLLLEALRGLQAQAGAATTPAMRLLIAGDGPLRADLEHRIREWRLQDGVTLAGYLPSADFFRQVHGLVLCSRIENLPYCILEAMAWARPVVATHVGGVSDLVRDGATGFLVPRDNAPALGRRLAQLAGDPSLARNLGSQGRGLLEAELTAAAMAQQHLACYRDLAGGLRPANM